MQIIKPNAVLLSHDRHPYEIIEQAGRTCYKSESNITPESARHFVKSLKNNHHLAMLEHAWLHFKCDSSLSSALNILPNQLISKPNTQHILDYLQIDYPWITGSFRAFYDIFTTLRDLKCDTIEFNKCITALRMLLSKQFPEIFDEFAFDTYPDDMVYDEDMQSVKTTLATITYYDNDSFFETCIEHDNKDILYTHLPHSIKFTCDRGVTHEFVRHRIAAFGQESTRYCNYAKDKFGNEITVIEPCFFTPGSAEYNIWKQSMQDAENAYFALLGLGAMPQQARDVLPNSLKTELIITAHEKEWQHIIDLRYTGVTGNPHPQMKEVMEIALPLLQQDSYNAYKL